MCVCASMCTCLLSVACQTVTEKCTTQHAMSTMTFAIWRATSSLSYSTKFQGQGILQPASALVQKCSCRVHCACMFPKGHCTACDPFLTWACT